MQIRYFPINVIFFLFFFIEVYTFKMSSLGVSLLDTITIEKRKACGF